MKPDGTPFQSNQTFVVGQGIYDDLVKHPQYIAKKEADEVSYVWDKLLGRFTDNVLAGTSVSALGQELHTADLEEGLRAMALEPRVCRRMLGAALLGAIEEFREKRPDRFARVALPGSFSGDRGTAYVFLITPFPTKVPLAGGYDQYRRSRAQTLYAYVLCVFAKNRELNRVVGIAIDGVLHPVHGNSEDMVVLEKPEWTPELEKSAEEAQELFSIMRSGKQISRRVETSEYPENESSEQLSRQQRRAQERQRWKAERRRP
jgi:hypothetical protein